MRLIPPHLHITYFFPDPRTSHLNPDRACMSANDRDHMSAKGGGGGIV